jgi:hypothetical protein
MRNIIFAIFCIFISTSCQKTMEPRIIIDRSDWLIPADQVYDGGPGKDGIPALINPLFVSPSEVKYLSGEDLVIGIKIGDEIRAYPHPILDWHEIVNDEIEGTKFAITYCPLTGSGIAWERIINGKETTFGVSGLLYNSNLIPYDRMTDSYWSQMLMLCVGGELKGTKVKILPIVETTWKTWLEMYPNTKVISSLTGYDRPYGYYPYGDYRTNHDLLFFPISYDDRRLPRKERVHGIIVKDKSRVYRILSFPDSISLINDNLNGVPIVVIGSRGKNFVVSFERELPDGTILTFTPVQDSLPIIMKDGEGNKWDIFGNAVEGPRKGSRLKQTKSFISYWFAWGTFFRGAEIYGER